jgi:F-type H+-transporting ATPase subunit a
MAWPTEQPGDPSLWGLGKNDMDIQSVFPQTVFEIAGIGIKDTVLHTWIVCAILIALAFWARKKYRLWEPATWQLAIETAVDYISNLIVGTTGRSLPSAVPYLTTMISFIALANLLGLVPSFRAPTRDLNTTLALSFISLASVQVYGIQKRGLLSHLKSFAEPVFVILPLNLLGMFSRTLSMALRLFGNVVAGEIVGAVMFKLVPVLVPLPFNFLSIITGVLQALVFTVLTLVYVVEAVTVEDEMAGTGR